MDRWLVVRSAGEGALPEPYQADDVRYSEALVRRFLDEYTEPGQVVLDPFAGFGTTMRVAEAMGRRGIAVELLEDRVAYIRSEAPDAAVIRGDARHLRDLVHHDVDFVMTSPPYMNRHDHPQNPLSGYQDLDGDYATYLGEIRDVFAQVADLLRTGSFVVINAANMRSNGTTTTLAWDIGRAVADVLHFEREIVVLDPALPRGFTQEYCLIFRR